MIVILGAAGTVPLAAVVFTLAYVFVGIRGPLHEEMLHRQVSGEGRSTMLSLDSLALQLGGIAGSMFSGLLAGVLGIPLTWAIVGAITGVSALLYLGASHPERAARLGRHGVGAFSGGGPSVEKEQRRRHAQSPEETRS